MAIEILNLKNEQPSKPYDFYVDRRSPVGNPFHLKTESYRDKVCDDYADYFEKMIKSESHEFCAYLQQMFKCLELYGQVRLFCWCVPKRCHAETIKSYLETKFLF